MNRYKSHSRTPTRNQNHEIDLYHFGSCRDHRHLRAGGSGANGSDNNYSCSNDACGDGCGHHARDNRAGYTGCHYPGNNRAGCNYSGRNRTGNNGPDDNGTCCPDRQPPAQEENRSGRDRNHSCYSHQHR